MIKLFSKIRMSSGIGFQPMKCRSGWASLWTTPGGRRSRRRKVSSSFSWERWLSNSSIKWLAGSLFTYGNSSFSNTTSRRLRNRVVRVEDERIERLTSSAPLSVLRTSEESGEHCTCVNVPSKCHEQAQWDAPVSSRSKGIARVIASKVIVPT